MLVDVHGSQFMALATPTRVPVSTNWPALHDSLLQANPAVTSKSTDARRWCPLQPRATQLFQVFLLPGRHLLLVQAADMNRNR